MREKSANVFAVKKNGATTSYQLEATGTNQTIEHIIQKVEVNSLVGYNIHLTTNKLLM